MCLDMHFGSGRIILESIWTGSDCPSLSLLSAPETASASVPETEQLNR